MARIRVRWLDRLLGNRCAGGSSAYLWCDRRPYRLPCPTSVAADHKAAG